MRWGYESLVRNVASTIPVLAGGVFDEFNQGIISIRTKLMFPCSWEVRAVLQVAACTLDTRSVPGASAEVGISVGLSVSCRVLADQPCPERVPD